MREACSARRRTRVSAIPGWRVILFSTGLAAMAAMMELITSVRRLARARERRSVSSPSGLSWGSARRPL